MSAVLATADIVSMGLFVWGCYYFQCSSNRSCQCSAAQKELCCVVITAGNPSYVAWKRFGLKKVAWNWTGWCPETTGNREEILGAEAYLG